MSKDDLHDLARADSPEAVDIPNTWQGLIVWAIARFGVGILVAGVFGYATKEVYADMRADRLQLMDAYRDNARAIHDFSTRIENLTKSMDDAHRRASP